MFKQVNGVNRVIARRPASDKKPACRLRLVSARALNKRSDEEVRRLRFDKREGSGHGQFRRLQRLQQAEFVARDLRIPLSVGFTVRQQDEALYTLSARYGAQDECATADLLYALQLPA